MFKWLSKFRYITASNASIRWTDAERGGMIAKRIEVFFLINGFGKTKVKYIAGKSLEGYPNYKATDHSWYSSIIVPWLEKTKWAYGLDRDEMIGYIKVICKDNEDRFAKLPPLPVPPKPTIKKTNTNILTFPKKDNDGPSKN